MTIEQLTRMAHARGFHTLAVTDHSQSSTIAGGLKPDRLRRHIDDVHAVHEKLHKELGITVLAGSEVDILADGSLDYKDELLAQLDVVVASPHAALTQDPATATARLLKAIAHPLVHILGHPTGRLVARRAGLSPDMAELIAAAKQHNVALEVNAHWMRLDLRDTHVRQAVNAGCLVAIDCDVHAPSDYDNLRFGVMTARRGWLTKDQCVNTWTAKKLHAWLKSKR
jgi:DNA polymerase (family 10)